MRALSEAVAAPLNGPWRLGGAHPRPHRPHRPHRPDGTL